MTAPGAGDERVDGPDRGGQRARWVGYGQTAAAFALILVAWQLVGLKVPRYLLPTPLGAAGELWARAPLLAQHALVTLQESGTLFSFGFSNART